MRRMPSVLFLLIPVLWSSAVPSPQASAVREPLAPLAFLVGSCWTGTFPDGKATDTHCFESMYDGHFIRDRHIVKGGKPYQGETIYGWDARAKKIVFTYWNSDGGISTGSAEPAAGEIVFPETHALQGGGQMTIKTVWSKTGTDAYDVYAAQLKDGQWREMWRMTMRRTADGQQPTATGR